MKSVIVNALRFMGMRAPAVAATVPDLAEVSAGTPVFNERASQP
jgi:hypothetical protein